MSDEQKQNANPDEEKIKAYRKLKPVGPVMKPLTDAEIDDVRNDPEVKERDALLDALPKGREIDDQDGF